GGAPAAYGLGDHRGPGGDGRGGDREHQGVHGRPPAAGPRSSVTALKPPSRPRAARTGTATAKSTDDGVRVAPLARPGKKLCDAAILRGSRRAPAPQDDG